MSQRALARIDLSAVEHNCRRLRSLLGETTAVRGRQGERLRPRGRAVRAGRPDGWSGWLAVATAEEAGALRRAGIEARILVMGALSPEELDVALDADADVVAWREGFVWRAASLAGRDRPGHGCM